MSNNYTVIDLEKEHRQQQFDYFQSIENPTYSATFEVNVTHLVKISEVHQVGFFSACMYAITQSAFSIPEFRRRIVGNEVRQYDDIDVSFTTLNQWKQVNFCVLPLSNSIDDFSKQVAEQQLKLKNQDGLQNMDAQRPNFFFCSCLPWVKLLSVSFPYSSKEASIPELVWGKAFQHGEKTFLNISVNAHHALVDGYHIGLLAKRISKFSV